MLSALTLHGQGALTVVWAPFDHVAADARLVVVGITPGRLQAENALQAFRRALMDGATPAEALHYAKWFIRHLTRYDGALSWTGDVPCVARRFACAR